MDINTLRSAITLLLLTVFLGIMAWTYSRRRAQTFDEAAMLPFLDEEPKPAVDDGLEKGARS